MPLELLFLGTGTSAGVPMIGCECEVCRSDDPHDQRTRPSVMVSYFDRDASATEQVRRLLIDTSPEMRLQVIRHRVPRIDGVLFTHAHADHIFGLDDLRRFNAVNQAPIDIHAEQATLDTIRATFWYIFEPHKNVNQSFVASLVPRPVEVGQAFDLFGAAWTPMRLLHGRLPIVGFRIEHEGAAMAYCTDVSKIPPESYPLLAGLDVLVIDALRYRHHPTHMTVDEALRVIDEVKPRQAYLTHIAHDIRHAELQPRLPAGVSLAYDGLMVRCEAAATMTRDNP